MLGRVCAPACSSRARSTCSTKPGVASEAARRGTCRMTGISLAFDSRLHRIDLAALTGGKHVTIYGQTEVTRDLMDGASAAGLATVYRGRRCRAARFRRRRALRRPTKGRHHASHRLRLHRRLRRLSRRQPQVGAASGASEDLRAALSVRLAGRAGRGAAGRSRAGLCQSQQRLCAVLDALDAPQPLLCAVPARRRSRGLVRRALLGRVAPPPAAADGGSRHHRAVLREVDRAAALLRCRADALRPLVPGRRRRPHRAADRRQGPQSRRQRRALSLRRPARVLSRQDRRPASTPIRPRRWRGSGRRCASPGG